MNQGQSMGFLGGLVSTFLRKDPGFFGLLWSKYLEAYQGLGQSPASAWHSKPGLSMGSTF